MISPAVPFFSTKAKKQNNANTLETMGLLIIATSYLYSRVAAILMWLLFPFAIYVHGFATYACVPK